MAKQLFKYISFLKNEEISFSLLKKLGTVCASLTKVIFTKLTPLYKKQLCVVLFQRIDFRLLASPRQNFSW